MYTEEDFTVKFLFFFFFHRSLEYVISSRPGVGYKCLNGFYLPPSSVLDILFLNEGKSSFCITFSHILCILVLTVFRFLTPYNDSTLDKTVLDRRFTTEN